MTAPLPKIKTVFVDSEKGSRLSLPSRARAPLTVTGTSSATGCCLMAESPEPDVARADPSGLGAKFSASFAIGGMAGTLAKLDFRTRPARSRAPR